MGIMEKKMETTMMGYMGFRVEGVEFFLMMYEVALSPTVGLDCCYEVRLLPLVPLRKHPVLLHSDNLLQLD